MACGDCRGEHQRLEIWNVWGMFLMQRIVDVCGAAHGKDRGPRSARISTRIRPRNLWSSLDLKKSCSPNDCVGLLLLLLVGSEENISLACLFRGIAAVFYCIALTGLDPSEEYRIWSSPRPACLCFLSARIKGVHHFYFCFVFCLFVFALKGEVLWNCAIPTNVDLICAAR